MHEKGFIRHIIMNSLITICYHSVMTFNRREFIKNKNFKINIFVIVTINHTFGKLLSIVCFLR